MSSGNKVLQTGRFDCVLMFSHFRLRFSFLFRNLLPIGGRKVAQSVAKFVSKFVANSSRNLRKFCCKNRRKFVPKFVTKFGAKLSQGCRNIVAKFVTKVVSKLSHSCRKVIAKLSQSWPQNLHKFMSLCCQSPLGEYPFTILECLDYDVAILLCATCRFNMGSQHLHP